MSSRLSITLQGRAAERLDRLSRGDRTKSDVVREALVLEEVFVEATDQGGKLFIHAADGTEREIVRA